MLAIAQGNFRATTRDMASELRSFFRHLSKNDAASGCDCAWLAMEIDLAGAQGSETAIKPERPETKGWRAKVGSVKKRASGAVLGDAGQGQTVIANETTNKMSCQVDSYFFNTS